MDKIVKKIPKVWWIFQGGKGRCVARCEKLSVTRRIKKKWVIIYRMTFTQIHWPCKEKQITYYEVCTEKRLLHIINVWAPFRTKRQLRIMGVSEAIIRSHVRDTSRDN